MPRLNTIRNSICIILLLIVSACSTVPVKSVSMNDLEGLRLNKFFKIDNSLEEILEHINREGEVVIEAVSKKSRGIKAKPYYIKIMATSEGLKTQLFPREPTD